MTSHSKINVLMILLDGAFPPDVRVEKETSVLLEADYNIFLLTRKIRGRRDFEVIDGIYVLRVDWPIKVRRLSYFVDRLKLFMKMISIILQYNISILHVHDLPFARLVVILGKIFRRKIVLDMHEHYVGMMRARVSYLLIFYLRVKEIVSCKFSTKIITVAEENAKRVVSLGIPANKVVVVSNTADTALLDRMTGDFIREKRLRGKFVVSYIGSFSLHRGLDTLVNAISLVVNKNPKIHLLLVGSRARGKMAPTLQEMVDNLVVRDYVTFTGWVPFDEAMRHIQLSDLGVIPHHSTPHTNATVPHKIFQYMYFEKPIFVSDVKPLKRIVEETECGIVFPAGDHVQLAEGIIKAMNNKEVLREMGKNGRTAVIRKYNWKVDGAKLVKLYEDLSKNY